MKKSPDSVDDSPDPLEGRKILVVDDEDDARTFISTVLEDAGAQVVTAASGDHALVIARKERPDAITLDISMPGRDGVDVFGELRDDPDTADIAICVITGHPEFRKVIYQRAVPPPEGYLHKPISDKDLISTMRRVLALRERKQGRVK